MSDIVSARFCYNDYTIRCERKRRRALSSQMVCNCINYHINFSGVLSAPAAVADDFPGRYEFHHWWCANKMYDYAYYTHNDTITAITRWKYLWMGKCARYGSNDTSHSSTLGILEFNSLLNLSRFYNTGQIILMVLTEVDLVSSARG